MDERPTILVVDDAPDLTRILSFHLARAGYRVLAACSGPEALQMIGRCNINLVITDLGMPGMTGVEVIAALKGAPATGNVPVVAVTGYPGSAVIAEASAAGADAFLSKPVSPQRLLDEVGDLLARTVPRPASAGFLRKVS